MLGAHRRTWLDGDEGTRFACGPNATRVSVVGDWCNWDDAASFPDAPELSESGLWELFVPGVGGERGTPIQVRLRTGDGALRVNRPHGAQDAAGAGHRVDLVESDTYAWRDGAWMTARRRAAVVQEPVHVYEVHLGSWSACPRRGPASSTYREIAPRLSEQREAAGLHAHRAPAGDGAPVLWIVGLSGHGYYAPTHVTYPDDFRFLVDTLHQAGIGGAAGLGPAHFPKNDYALRRFDGKRRCTSTRTRGSASTRTGGR